MKHLIALLCLLMAVAGWTQPESGPLISSNNYMGVDAMWPTLKKDWKLENPWLGFSGQMSFLRFGYGYGSAVKLQEGTIKRQQGRYGFVGVFYNYPLHIWRNGIAIEPEFGLDVFYGRLPDHPDAKQVGMGFGITPGIGFKMGFIKVVGKYTAGFAVNPFTKQNAWNGGMAYPLIGLYMETGWGLLNPKEIRSGGVITTTDVQRNYSYSYRDGDSWYDVYRETTSYTDHHVNSVVYDVGPFWYLAPRVASGVIINDDKRDTFRYGAAVGGRLGVWVIDAFYDQGKTGFQSPIEPYAIEEVYGVQTDLTGYRHATNMGVHAGVDFVGLLKNMFISYDDERVKLATRFVRFIVTYGVGKAEFEGQPYYNEPTALAQIQNIYALKPEFNRGPGYNPAAIDASGFRIVSVRVEMGIAAIGFESYNYKDANFADGKQVMVSLLIPPSRLLASLSAKHAAHKIYEDAKNK